MTKFLSLLSFLIFLTLTGTTCKNSPTEPEKPSEPDTTSQNFTFETKEFGDGFSSSYFNDVWVFSENNIWAVGYISQNQFQGNCNIMRWNGTEWKYINSNGISTSSGLTGIWALDSTHIYFANNSIGELKNGVYKSYVIPGNWTQGQAITKLWGSSESNIWGVGPKGTMVHYDGVSWKKIDVDTKWYFFNVTGNTNSGEGYALVSSIDTYTMLVKLTEKGIDTLYKTNIISGYHVKFQDNWLIISANQGFWWFDLNAGKIDEDKSFKEFVSIATFSLLNTRDIFGFSGSNKMVHYNGFRYKTVDLPEHVFGYMGSTSINSLTVAVGSNLNDKALILKIKRSN